MTEQEPQNVGKGNDTGISLFRKIKERRKLFKRLLYIIAAGVTLIILLVLILKVFFVVREIEVVGVRAYKDGEVIDASGIDYKGSIFAVSQSDVEKRILAEFPYVKSVLVDKEYPSRIVMNVKEEYTTFYFEMDGEYFLFNHGLKLIDKFDSEEGLKKMRSSAICVRFPEVKRAVVPEYIEFTDDSVFDYCNDVVFALSSTMLISGVESIDLTNRYDISFKYDRRIDISIGQAENAAKKLEHITKIVSEHSDTVTGTIDASSATRIDVVLSEP